MAYTAKCDTAAATYWWITGTGTAEDTLSEVMDDNGAGVEEDNNPGNFQPWTTFMTEHVDGGLYQIHLSFNIGDGTTTTTLTSQDEFVYFDNGSRPYVSAQATLDMGITGSGDAPAHGAAWRWQASAYGENFVVNNATWTCYDSYLMLSANASGRGPEIVPNASVTMERSIMSQEAANDVLFLLDSNAQSYKHNYSCLEYGGFDPQETPIAFEDNVSGNSDDDAFGCGWGDLTLTEPDWYGYGAGKGAIGCYRNNVTVVDSKKPVTVRIGFDGFWIKETYTVNIHVVDKYGNNLSGVSVACEDTNGDAGFTTQTTAADGTITEQNITYKQWVDIVKTLTTYSPHKFTLSKPGYETLPLGPITVDGHIVWHLELQPIRSRALGRGSRRAQVSNFE